jgi:uncharacterized OB-fold protein
MNNSIKIWRDHKKISGNLDIKGKVVSWTFIRAESYPIVLTKLENGKTILTQMVDFTENQLKCGQKVVTVIRKTTEPLPDEVVSYGIKVKPI